MAYDEYEDFVAWDFGDQKFNTMAWPKEFVIESKFAQIFSQMALGKNFKPHGIHDVISFQMVTHIMTLFETGDQIKKTWPWFKQYIRHCFNFPYDSEILNSLLPDFVVEDSEKQKQLERKN